ncbi:MAG: prephenate dehydrogenase/arogenate dehydrogenase family protein [Ottowia sp.]
MTPAFEQLGLIGCGLMGGSFALALKRAGLVRRVVGYSKSPSTMERARKMGVIDVPASSALLAASRSDLILLAVPVAATEDTLDAIRRVLAHQALVMDVGSTKADVVAAARRVLRDDVGQFVPCHPIAGSEASGIEHASATLYDGAQVVLTPIERTLTAQLARATALWEALGCRVRVMSPAAHDAAFAAVSHLPHLLAFAYMNALAGQPDGAGHLTLAGAGFQDFSRIAGANPRMWCDIFTANRQEMLAQIGHFRQALQQLETLIADGDAPALEAAIAAASLARAQWQPAAAGTTSTA